MKIVRKLGLLVLALTATGSAAVAQTTPVVLDPSEAHKFFRMRLGQ